MADTLKALQSLIGTKGRSDVTLGDDFRKNTYTAHTAELADKSFAGIDLAARDITHTGHTDVLDAVKSLKKADRQAERASEFMKDIFKDETKELTTELKEKVLDYRSDFQDMVQANRDAVSALQADHKETVSSIKEMVRDEAQVLKDAIRDAKDAKSSQVSWKSPNSKQTYNLTIDEALKEVKNVESRGESAIKQAEAQFKDALKGHTKVEAKLQTLATKLEEKSGHDLMKGVSTEAGAVDKAVATGEKALAEEAKVMGKGKATTIALGSALVGVDGLRRVLSPDPESSKGLGFVEIAASAVGLAKTFKPAFTHGRT